MMQSWNGDILISREIYKQKQKFTYGSASMDFNLAT